MSDKTTNDLLCQLVEGQTALLGEFREHKGKTEARLEQVESTAKWNKIMTYVVNPAIGLLSAVALHFGVPIVGRRP
jgi:hypothetical protein